MYFGVHESECYRATHVDSGRPWLFPPRLAPAYAIWDVKINDEDWFRRNQPTSLDIFSKDNLLYLVMACVLSDRLQAGNQQCKIACEAYMMAMKQIRPGYHKYQMERYVNMICLSDVTSSFPVSGKFTDKQKTIYNAVPDANRQVFKAAKPGMSWKSMLAEKTILGHLKTARLVVGSVEEMISARIGTLFMPHGLGHPLGLDMHDVGGYLRDAKTR